MSEFRCTIIAENDNRWFVYWINEKELFGVTDGKSKVYEAKLDRTKRRNFLGSVAESLLEENWKEAFDDSSFSVKYIDEREVLVGYVVDKITLKSVDEDITEKISNILYLAISTLNGLMQKASSIPSRPSASTLSKLRPKKAIPKSEHSSIIDPTKRKRHRPTGLQFSD